MISDYGDKFDDEPSATPLLLLLLLLLLLVLLNRINTLFDDGYRNCGVLVQQIILRIA